MELGTVLLRADSIQFEPQWWNIAAGIVVHQAADLSWAVVFFALGRHFTRNLTPAVLLIDDSRSTGLVECGASSGKSQSGVVAACDAGLEIDDSRVGCHAIELVEGVAPDVRRVTGREIGPLACSDIVTGITDVRLVNFRGTGMPPDLVNPSTGHDIAAQEQGDQFDSSASKPAAPPMPEPEPEPPPTDPNPPPEPSESGTCRRASCNASLFRRIET